MLINTHYIKVFNLINIVTQPITKVNMIPHYNSYVVEETFCIKFVNSLECAFYT